MKKLTLLLAIGSWVMADSITLQADESSPKLRLNNARAAFEAEVERLNQGMISLLEKREELARKDGNKKLSEELKLEKELFANTGELPKTVPTSNYIKGLKSNRMKMIAEYDIAVKELTKKGFDKEARTVEGEKEMFRSYGMVGIEKFSRQNDDSQLVIKSNKAFFSEGEAKKVFPDQAFEIEDAEGILLVKEIYGKKGVLCTAPAKESEPATIDFSELTRSKKGNLFLFVTTIPEAKKTNPGGAIIAKVANREILNVRVREAGEWVTLKIPFNKESVIIEHHAIGWHYEGMLFDYLLRETPGIINPK
jgi:hypothetical protein